MFAQLPHCACDCARLRDAQPDNDLGRDQHERELNFPNMCGLLCGSVAERGADDSRCATAVAKKVLAFAGAVCGCNVDLGGDLGCF